MAEEEKKKEGGSFLSSLGRIQPLRPPAPAGSPPPPPSRPPPPAGGAALKPMSPSPAAEGAAHPGKLAELERAVKALQAEVQTLKSAPKQDPKTEKDIEQAGKKIEALDMRVSALDGTAIQERISASAVKIAALEAGFSDMTGALLALKQEVSEAAAEFSADYLAVKNGLQALKTDSKYLEGAVEKLKAKAAELEKDLGPGLEELRSKLSTLEKLERRQLLELQNGLEKAFHDKFRDMLSQLKSVREKLDAVSEDYRLVIDKRLLALEAHLEAFGTFSRRLDSLAQKKQR